MAVVRHVLRPDGRAAVCGQFGPFQRTRRGALSFALTAPCATCRKRIAAGHPSRGSYLYIVRGPLR